MVVITGAGGQLGTAFANLLPDALLLTRDQLDLTARSSIRRVLDEVVPRLLINCAAYTAVDAAEEDETTAMAVNADAVATMAEWCADHGAKFVTFSTDYVFGGDSDDPYVESSVPNPASAYGRTKLAGERATMAANPSALIIRTSWVISGTHENFVATMLRLAPKQELSVVDDQTGCPTIAADLAAATLAAVEKDASGVLHLTNGGPTTWFGLARAAVALAGIDPERISPCSTQEFPRPAPRPANSVLASERVAELGLPVMPEWRDSLPSVVNALLAAT